MDEAQYKADFETFKALSDAAGSRFAMEWSDRLPFLNDRTAQTAFDRHYIYHPAWAARVLAETRPAYHVDISSTLAFCTTVSAFVPVRFYDYRPADLQLSNLTSDAADLTALPFPDASVASLSCMHVVEHVGLGRYGDALDPTGDLKAMRELTRVLAPGGSLLFVVPIGGRAVIRFNGHRIYCYRQVVDAFANLTLARFSLIPQHGSPRGGLIDDATEQMADGERYGCGCFWFRRGS